MEDRSTSWALFRQSAEDLAVRLAEVAQPDAQKMAREARELAEVFREWERARPTNETRIAAIQTLFTLNRRAMDYLSKQGRGSSSSGPPSSRRPSSL